MLGSSTTQHPAEPMLVFSYMCTNRAPKLPSFDVVVRRFDRSLYGIALQDIVYPVTGVEVWAFRGTGDDWSVHVMTNPQSRFSPHRVAGAVSGLVV